MPRLVDHEERRREITGAARRVIAHHGLRAATFQSVAEEAGISVRLVQYYFGSKRDVLLATHQAVVADAGRRFAQRLAGLGAGAEPAHVVRGLLVELLPTDGARREDAVVLGAFHADGLTGSDLTSEETLGAPRLLVDAVAAQVRRLRAPEGAHLADLDAWLVVAAAAGLAQAMLADPVAAARADELLDRLLDRMLAP
ncbi:TetR/AcrR family transcriptional regulator [Cellulomonas sp. NPDC057328]|uniref:TetR/AcrR family transcriptional regulator n=1 Tax=Cellulomonas sp. NPDC057328 TaxID=3346101 RepID=UPI003638EED1